MPHLIRFEGVGVHYPQGDGTVKHVLVGLDLHVRPGEIVSVVGPTGCGKSTLFRLLLGSQFPNRGRVLFDGAPVERPGRDRGIVFQKYGLFDHLSVEDNIAFGPLLEHTSLPERISHWPSYFTKRSRFRAAARAFVQHIGLTEQDCHKHPFELSGGMRQRVAIAQALIMQPKVLLMDEPFGALDERTRPAMQNLLLTLWQQHRMTVLFVTHDLEEALYVGTRIIALSQHWQDDSGGHHGGSRIVLDRALPPGDPANPQYKYTPEFTNMLQSIRDGALNPSRRLAPSEFDLTHPDAVMHTPSGPAAGGHHR